MLAQNRTDTVSTWTPDSLLTDTFSYRNIDPILSEPAGQLNDFRGISSFVMERMTEGWHFYFLIALLVGYAIARAFLGRLLSSTFAASVRYNVAASMFKDNSQLQRQRDLVLYIFYFLSLGFFLMILSEHYQFRPYGLKGISLAGFYSGLSIFIFYVRSLLLNLLGHIFYQRALYKEYLYLGYAYNKLLGILLLPVNFILAFSTDTLKTIALFTSIILLILLILMRISRGIIFAYKHNVFNFYLFLYLCALELVPVLLFYKWFSIIV